jgi:acyl-coenzyme A synthetase/AMP-(fatty) acid ligase
VNGYGPTEVTTFTTCHVVPPEQEAGFSVPIGRPIRKTWIRLLDDSLEPVPDGAPGHLYAGGGGLARGYLGDPALTAERFIPDPWSSGQRLYFTGDLARRRSDGAIEFLGRADQQIKKRGFRVEPAEIEEALRRDPHLRDAAVVPEGDTADERLLVAYVVPRTPAAARRELVPVTRSRLRGRLPKYLIPDQWVVLDAFPLTANGKVDRRALADVSAARVDTREAARDGLDPQTEVERALAAIWRTIFQVDWVGRHDDFFELGGHSLLASRMISRARSTIGIEVPLTAVFDHPTVAQMAELIENVLTVDGHGQARGSQGNP